MKRSLRKIWSDRIPYEQDDTLKVGDIAEFHQRGNPQPRPAWRPEVVQEIRITEEYADKEGKLVSEVRWSAVRNHECMVIVVGADTWGRNDDLRPTPKALRRAGGP